MALGIGVAIDKYTLWEILQEQLPTGAMLLTGLCMPNKLGLHPGSTFYDHDALRQTVLFFPTFLAFLTRKINCAIKRINKNHDVKEITLRHRFRLQILLPFYLFLKHSTFLPFCLCTLVRVFSELWIWGCFSLTFTHWKIKDDSIYFLVQRI